MSWTITRLWPSSLVKPYLTINDVITLSLPLFFFQERCWRKQEVVRHLWHEVGDVTTTQHTHASFINDAPCACVFVCRAPAQKHARGPNYPWDSWRLSPQKTWIINGGVTQFCFVCFLTRRRRPLQAINGTINHKHRWMGWRRQPAPLLDTAQVPPFL